MNSTERLVHMANQIATNLATDDAPVAAVAEHIQLFWDPRMKQMVFAHGTAGLSPIAAAAISLLADAQNGG
ncbi:formate dehydrogenase subunit delta [Sphingorhabdus sp.]|uniref:formate dehydrogenase subunit delta n=1 Tax=Sphingorhabdus sp. TaxID=1902408 RepID=UPI003983225E